MRVGAASHPTLLASAGEFLGKALGALPRVNTNATRRYHTQAVRRQFSLPDAMLDAIYG
jgi:hypothetical protein